MRAGEGRGGWCGTGVENRAKRNVYESVQASCSWTGSDVRSGVLHHKGTANGRGKRGFLVLDEREREEGGQEVAGDGRG